MARIRLSIQSLLCFVVLVLAGCTASENQDQESTTKADPHAGHSHATLGPHHGHLVELGDEDYHAEWRFDNSSGKVTIYLLDADVKKDVTTTADQITVRVTQGKITSEYELPAINASESDPPTASQFEVVNAELLESLKAVGHGIEAKLSVTIEDKQYTGSFEHLPH